MLLLLRSPRGTEFWYWYTLLHVLLLRIDLTWKIYCGWKNMNFWTDQKSVLQKFIYCCGFAKRKEAWQLNNFRGQSDCRHILLDLNSRQFWHLMCGILVTSDQGRVSRVRIKHAAPDIIVILSHGFLASQGPGPQSAVKHNYLDWILSDTNCTVHLSFIALQGWHLMRKRAFRREEHYSNEPLSIESRNQQLEWNLHMTLFNVFDYM